MEFLRSWVVNIVLTMIFVTIVEIMMPGGSTRKYIGLVIGLMVMFVIINPFLSLMAGDFDFNSSVLEASRAIALKDVDVKINRLEQGSRDGIIRLYKSNLEEQVKKEIEDAGFASKVRAEVEIDGEYGTEGFGNITAIRVVILDSPKAGPGEGIEKVEKIVVEIDDGKKEPETGETGQYREIVKYLARTYNLQEERIHIVLP
jgi:stage III sporulation protein AF